MLKILELFGGIGACTQALKRLGIDFEIADYVEIDKYAVKSYNVINGTNFEPQDITKWNKQIDADLIMHGSPCQDFSLAGKQAGGDEDSGTRSSLMYETIRIVESLQPKYVVWENVKNLLSKKHRHNFDAYLEELNQLGYNNYYQVLNAKDYGIPQNRERVYTISIRKDIDNKTFTFPEPEELKLKLKDLLENNVEEKYYISENLKIYYDRKIKQGWRKQLTTQVNSNISSTICNPARNNINDTFVIGGFGKVGTTNQYHLQNRIYEGDTSNTICTTCNPYYIDKNLKIRKLTPKECWRLMGFSDESFEKAKKVNSNTQLYKQAGNSIVVDVLYKIFKNLLKD